MLRTELKNVVKGNRCHVECYGLEIQRYHFAA